MTENVTEKFVLIESEGLLYRGPAPDHPTAIWDYPRGRWVPYRYAGQQESGWGEEITSERAESLKTNNPSAEHYRYYDKPPWSQPLSQAYVDAITPETVRKAQVARDRKSKI